MKLTDWRAWIGLAMGAALAVSLSTSCRNSKNRGLISATGTVEAVEVTVSAKTSGQVEKMFFEEGARVKVGDVLAVIDSSSWEIQLRQAQAGVDLAEAQLQLLLKGARSEDIRQTEESLIQAEANLWVAEDDFKRIRSLFDKESATAKQKQDAEAHYQVAQAQHEAAQQAFQKMKKLSRPEEVRAAQARLDQALAARDLLKKTISDATIVSPTSGIVTHKAVEAGEFVGPATPLLTVADLDKVRLDIYITGIELGKVHLGQPAEVTIDSHPGRTFPGQVIFISPEAEFTPKNVQTREERVKLVYRVKIEIPNQENILKPGMPADAQLRINSPASR
jgi:HlyD family secretion protein